MQTYFLRTIAADYEQMIALGVTLGAIVHTPHSERTYEREIYESILVELRPGEEGYGDEDYDQAWTTSVPTGRFETVTEVTEERIHAPGGCWDYIGPIYVPTGEVIETDFGPQPVMTPRTDAQGREYIHVNLITPVNLKEAAQALAAAHPEVAAGLANLSKYFLVDADGNAVAPNMPHRVFAT